MHCIYFENLNDSDEKVILEPGQVNHLKALRLRTGDEILVTNGKGLTAKAVLEIQHEFRNKSTNETLNKFSHSRKFRLYTLHPIEFFNNLGELPFRLGLIMPLLSSSERRDFTIEKAVELGVTDFFPAKTRYSQIAKYDYYRIRSKSIAATEQCRRSMLMHIYHLTDLFSFFNDSPSPSWFEKIIVADINGSSIEKEMNYNSVLAIVGPEGGFSPEETELLKQQQNISFIKIAERRLRSETAALAALSLLTNLNKPK